MSVSYFMKQRLLLITDKDLGIISKGNIMRIRNILKGFVYFDFEIVLICAGISIHDPLRKLCKQVVCVRDWFDGGDISSFSPGSYSEAIGQVTETFSPDIVIVEYAWMATCLDSIQTHCLKAIDTHDILHEHAQQYIQAGLVPWVNCSREQEKELLARAGIIIAIQEEEAKKFRQLVPGTQVVCIPHLGEVQRRTVNTGDKTPVIGFIGSAHAGNRGILSFIEHCWPVIKQSIPTAKLLIAGSVADWIAEGDDIQTMPFINDINAFYDSVTLVICPVTMGTGLKIKLVEALLYGKAVVITTIASEGLPSTTGKPYLLAGEWVSFSQQVIRLCTDRIFREKIEAAATLYAEQYFSYQAGINNLLASSR